MYSYHKYIGKDAINVPIALSAFRDGDQGPSKVTKTELIRIHCLYTHSTVEE